MTIVFHARHPYIAIIVSAIRQNRPYRRIVTAISLDKLATLILIDARTHGVDIEMLRILRILSYVEEIHESLVIRHICPCLFLLKSRPSAIGILHHSSRSILTLMLLIATYYIKVIAEEPQPVRIVAQRRIGHYLLHRLQCLGMLGLLCLCLAKLHTFARHFHPVTLIQQILLSVALIHTFSRLHIHLAILHSGIRHLRLKCI